MFSLGTALTPFGVHCGLKKLKPLVNITELMYPKFPVPCPKHLAEMDQEEVDQGRLLLQGAVRWGGCQTICFCCVNSKGQPWQTTLTFRAAVLSVSSSAYPPCAAEFPLFQLRERCQWLLSNASFLSLHELFIASL